ncbi:MAG: hypothetical protein IPN29_15035 [Saprospiraceae bacterium]|nr:hypothetical protein [Saprospiraceae bacterium]
MEKSALGSSKVERLTDIDSLTNNLVVYFDGGRFLYQLNFFSRKKINFKYDIFSKEITLLSNPDYYDKWLKPKGGYAISEIQTTVKLGNYFYTCDQTLDRIVRFKVDNLADYEIIKEFGKNYPKLTSLYGTMPVSCDSLMVMGRFLTERDSLLRPIWQDALIDPNTFEYRFLECDLLTIKGISEGACNFSDAVYLKAPICELTLDADADDSRFKGDTFYQVQTCGLNSPVNLVDEDVEIRSNGGRIAWCRIKLSGVMEPDKEILVFNTLQGYNLTHPSPSEWLLSPADKFDLHALEKVLSGLQYKHTGSLATEGKREVSIEVKLTSGQSTSIDMEILVNTKPTWEGADVEHHVCLDGTFLSTDCDLAPRAVSGGE